MPLLGLSHKHSPTLAHHEFSEQVTVRCKELGPLYDYTEKNISGTSDGQCWLKDPPHPGENLSKTALTA